MENQGMILHFGVRIKKNEKNKIARENYAVIDKRNSTWTPKTPSLYCRSGEYKKYFEDEECKIYNDLFCEEWQEKCLINFDKNMAFFAQIPQVEFEEALHQLIKSSKMIKQILDLNECNGVRGVYIMVLDEYKQLYIGQAQDIKKRIMAHWSKRKPFDRLLFGKVNDSVLSIDSFGALDTTRIFTLETDDLDYYEIKMQKKIPSAFKLNRMGGGVPEDYFDLVSKALDRNSHNLKDFHNEEFAEKFEMEMDITCFESKGYCALEELVQGDIICLERTERGKLLPTKYYGEVIRATKTRLWVYKYCGSILGNSCFSSNFKGKKLLPEEIRVKKTMLFSKVDMIEKKETHTFWRSKKFPHLEA